jgi:hypothetical protein
VGDWQRGVQAEGLKGCHSVAMWEAPVSCSEERMHKQQKNGPVRGRPGAGGPRPPPHLGHEPAAAAVPGRERAVLVGRCERVAVVGPGRQCRGGRGYYIHTVTKHEYGSGSQG